MREQACIWYVKYDSSMGSAIKTWWVSAKLVELLHIFKKLNRLNVSTFGETIFTRPFPATWWSYCTYWQDVKQIHTPGPSRAVQRSVSVLGETGFFHRESAIWRPVQIIGSVPFHAWGKMAWDRHRVVCGNWSEETACRVKRYNCTGVGSHSSGMKMKSLKGCYKWWPEWGDVHLTQSYV